MKAGGVKWRKSRRGAQWSVLSGYMDRIARAFEREREHRRVLVPECDSAFAHVFWCVCCGRLRGEEERREPRSEVCVRCVREAGFWN